MSTGLFEPVSAEGVGYPAPRAFTPWPKRPAGAAKQALDAGFDGVEVHAGNGYLVDQFLRDASNVRTDTYGGNPRNRLRLLNEILDAVCGVWPAHRVGVRFTPENSFNSMADSDPQAHHRYFLDQIRTRDLAYVHMLEGDQPGPRPSLPRRPSAEQRRPIHLLRRRYDRIHRLPHVRSLISSTAASDAEAFDGVECRAELGAALLHLLGVST